MTFVVNTIKQGIKKTKNIQFLIDVDSPLFARKIVESSGLVLLSISDSALKLSDFGPVYVMISYEMKDIRIVGKSDFNLKDLCTFFLRLGFDVIDGNYFEEAQSTEQVKKVIEICKREIDEKKLINIMERKKKEDIEKKTYYQNDGLEKAKTVIAWSLEKVNNLLVDKGAFISAKDLRTIKEKVEELKKLRMGTNYEKTRDMLQDLFLMVDRIEEAYFASLENSSNVLFDGTVVTAIDLENQLSILEKVQQQQIFGGTVAISRKDYVAFGELLIYLKFFKKDFLDFLQNILLYVDKIFDIVQIGVVMILFSLSLMIVFSFFSDITFLYNSFISIGFFGFCVFVAGLFRVKNPLFVGMVFLIVLSVYFFGLPLLKHTFAL